MSGASGLENQYVVDGTNVTNTGYGGLGSYSITFGSLGNATPYDFIKEVQVKTGGYEAEFGQATGGVVNVITKSGANQLRGSAFGYTQPSGLEAGWKQYQAINGSVNTDVDQPERRRHRSRRPDRQGQDVLLRRDRPGLADEQVHRAGGLPAREPRRRGARPQHHLVCGQGHGSAQQLQPHRRLVLRRPVARRRGPAADDGPDAYQHGRLQHARLRRPPAEPSIRRRHELELPHRSVVRALPQPDRRAAVGRSVGRHRHDRRSQHQDRRHRELRTGQRQQQQAVVSEGDEHLRRTPDQVRRPVRRRGLPAAQPAHGPDVRGARTAGRRRRAPRSRSSRT